MIYLTVSSVVTSGILGFAVWRLLEAVTVEREAFSRERTDLIQRIQAPDTAVAVQAQRDMDDVMPPKLHLAFDADQEFADYQREIDGEPIA